jgi:hypothetical protein
MFQHVKKDAFKLKIFLLVTFAISASAECDACFPASALVRYANGSTIEMQYAAVGDKLYINGDEEGSDLYMFGHQMPPEESMKNIFLQIETRSAEKIRISPGHLLYVNKILAPARNVQIGDYLETFEGRQTPVIDISKVADAGLYNPQTMHGDIVVDGIRASTYTDALHPLLAHSLLAPARALRNLKIDIED